MFSTGAPAQLVFNMRLPRFVPVLEGTPEERPAYLRWADLVGRLLFWHDHRRWEGLSFAERVQWLDMFEES